MMNPRGLVGIYVGLLLGFTLLFLAVSTLLPP